MTLKQLHKKGIIKNLVDRGLMSPTVLSYFDYNNTFMSYRSTMSYRQSVELTADDHKVSTATIKRAVMVLNK